MLRHLHSISRDAAAAVDGNAATLRLMRLRRGWSMRYVAGRMGKQAPWLSKIEKRQLRLSPDDLALFASVFGVPVELLGEEIAVADSEGTHFRSLKLPEKVRERAEAEANFRAHLVTKLLDVADQRTTHTFPSVDVRALPKGPERAASHLREMWGVEGPLSKLVPLAERSGMFITPTPADVSPRVRGLTVQTAGAAPHTLVSRAAPPDAQRLTVAHEIGHLVMDSASGTASDKEVEERANRFAGELLAPYAMIRDTLRRVSPRDLHPLFELQAEWGVHPMSFVLRGNRHGDLDDETSTSLYRLLNSRHKNTLDHMRSPFPAEFQAVDDLLTLLKSVGWSESHVATFLHVNIGEAAEVLDGWARVFDSPGHIAPVRQLAVARP